jgi:hypothetical protein
MGQQVDFDFDGAFQKLQDAFRQKYGRDFTITGQGSTPMHRRLSAGRARDIRSRDLSDDEQQFIISQSKALGLDVVDQSRHLLPGASGPHIHVGKYLRNSPARRATAPQSVRSKPAGVKPPPVADYKDALDSILSDYGVAERAAQQPAAPPAPPADERITPEASLTDANSQQINNTKIVDSGRDSAKQTPAAPARPEPPATELIEPGQGEPPADYARQLDSILSDYGVSEPPPAPGSATRPDQTGFPNPQNADQLMPGSATRPDQTPGFSPAPKPKPRLFEQPDTHNRVAQLRQSHAAGVPVQVQIGDLLDTGALTDETLSDRVMESATIGMSPAEAAAFKDILKQQGRGLPFKLSDPQLKEQLHQHRDSQGNVTLHLSADSLVTYQDYLSSIRERRERASDNQGAINGTIGQRSPFINETVNINARDPNSIFEKAEQRIGPDRVMVTYKTNHATEHATAAEASPDAGTIVEDKAISELGPQDYNKMVATPLRVGGLLAALDKGQINKQQFLDDLRYRQMAELGFDQQSIEAYKSAYGKEPIWTFADQGAISKKGSKVTPYEGTSPDQIIERIRKNGGIYDGQMAVPHFLHFKQFLANNDPDLLPHEAQSQDTFDPESTAQLAAALSATTGMDYDKAHDRVLQGLTAVGNFGRGMLTTASGAVKGAGLIGETLFTENRPSSWLQEKGSRATTVVAGAYQR